MRPGMRFARRNKKDSNCFHLDVFRCLLMRRSIGALFFSASHPLLKGSGPTNGKSILFISLTEARLRGYIKANPYSREFRWQTMN
jgi:hypothetical protein